MTNRARLPDSWAECRIEDIFATLEDGRTLHQGWSPQCESYPSPSEEIWGALRTTAVQPNSFHDEHNKCLPDKLAPRPLLEVKVGDILVTCAGPRARCGIACLVRAVRPRLMISGKMYRFRMSEASVEPRFVEYFLQTPEAQAAIDRMKTGGSDSGLNLTHERFRQLVVRLAPRNEQSRIVQEIEKQFTRLDAAVVALKRVQANLKRYRAAVLKAACEGRLVPIEAELARPRSHTYESASELIGRIRGGQDAVVMEHQGDGLGELPEGWVWTKFSRLVADGPQNGLYLPKTKYGRGTPILRIDDFQNHESRPSSDLRLVEASAEEVAMYSLVSGDMVINRVNSPSHLGKLLFVKDRNLPALFESNMMRIRLSGSISTQYVVLYLASTEGRAKLTSRAKWAVNQASINQEDVLLTPIPLPPASEQHRIVAEVSRQFSVVEEVERQIETQLDLAHGLRQSILKRAFNGKLARQNENDEPAIALLERIRTERTTEPQTSGFRGRRRKKTLHVS